jgi:hypothetical protein
MFDLEYIPLKVKTMTRTLVTINNQDYHGLCLQEKYKKMWIVDAINISDHWCFYLYFPETTMKKTKKFKQLDHNDKRLYDQRTGRAIWVLQLFDVLDVQKWMKRYFYQDSNLPATNL